jgi:hypothetical protein
MTIESRLGAPRWSWVRQAAVALAAWCMMVVGVTVAFEPTSDVVAIGPTGRTLDALRGSDTRIQSIGANTVRLGGTEPGFVRALYANGVWLVLPSPFGGCGALGRWLQ